MNKALDYWVGMPEFIQKKLSPFKKIKIAMIDGSHIFIRFENKNDYDKFIERCFEFNFSEKTAQRYLLSKVANQKITNKTKSIWFPYKSHWGGVKHKYVSDQKIKNRYPVYIVSKGRAKNGLTTKALNKMRVEHYIVVESQEKKEYEKYNNANILILPSEYLDNYDTCDNLGNKKSKGPGAERNVCIDHSKNNGFSKHWVMDDNLDAFHYLNKNNKFEVESASTIAAAEDFTDRFSNVPIAGFNYYSFCKKDDAVPPFTINTRIYSCLLMCNLSGYRWRGRYNEDTDICLRVLKDGLCTIQFNAFLCGKVTTQRMKGGNTKEFYSSEGTLPKSEMLQNLHPDVASVVWKFNRWHHKVEYKKFKANNLLLIDEKVKNSETILDNALYR